MDRSVLIEEVIDVTIKSIRELIKETSLSIAEIDTICRFAKSSALARTAERDELFAVCDIEKK